MVTGALETFRFEDKDDNENEIWLKIFFMYPAMLH